MSECLNLKCFTILSKDNQIRINYYNFWYSSYADLSKSWLNKVFQKLFANISQPINIVSVFGEPFSLKIKTPGLKIFFSGENIKHPNHYNWYYYLHTPYYRKSFDLIISFEYYKWDNYVRMPLWFCNYVLQSLLKSQTQLDIDSFIYTNISNWVANCNNPELRNNSSRTRDFAMIASHDSTNLSKSYFKSCEFIGLRGEITDYCSKLGKVDCGGKLLNNTMELLQVYKNNKNEYLKNYKFNICPENSNSLGYTTEKIFDSINAGCIPIYAGSCNQVEPGILNPQAFILYDRKDNAKALAKIRSLLENENKYQEFIQIPPFLPSAVDKIFAIYQNLKCAISKLTPPPPRDSKTHSDSEFSPKCNQKPQIITRHQSLDSSLGCVIFLFLWLNFNYFSSVSLTFGKVNICSKNLDSIPNYIKSYSPESASNKYIKDYALMDFAILSKA